MIQDIGTTIITDGKHIIRNNKMTVTLAKLLKQKNLLVAEINDLNAKIHRENKTIGVNVSKYDLKLEYAKLLDVIDELVKVKTAIAKHNVSIVDKIYRMSELKNQIAMLKGMDVMEGTFTSNGYGRESTTEVYKVQFDRLFVDEQVSKLTAEIVELQDELDTHNHVTQIDL